MFDLNIRVNVNFSRVTELERRYLIFLDNLFSANHHQIRETS